MLQSRLNRIQKRFERSKKYYEISMARTIASKVPAILEKLDPIRNQITNCSMTKETLKEIRNMLPIIECVVNDDEIVINNREKIGFDERGYRKLTNEYFISNSHNFKYRIDSVWFDKVDDFYKKLQELGDYYPFELENQESF